MNNYNNLISAVSALGLNSPQWRPCPILVSVTLSGVAGCGTSSLSAFALFRIFALGILFLLSLSLSLSLSVCVCVCVCGWVVWARQQVQGSDLFIFCTAVCSLLSSTYLLIAHFPHRCNCNGRSSYRRSYLQRCMIAAVTPRPNNC
jgi:hypothetical protein